MRIAIDARLNGYRAGGISEYTRNLIESLAALDGTRDYAFYVLHAARATNDSGNRTPAPNFQRVTAFTPPHHRLERLALSAEIARLRLDLLHSPDFVPPYFGARRHIITIHDLNFLLYPQFKTADSVRYYTGNIRAAVRQADHILANSQATKNELQNLLDVPADKITVHLLGVNPAFRPLPDETVRPVLDRYNLSRGYLLFVGTLEPRKNLTGLLDAYHKLCVMLPETPPLVLVGNRGWLYEGILDKIRDLGLGERVRWIEGLPFVDLPAMYNGAAALVLPSFYEGFGLPALEAMACGTPTVVSDRGALPEVVGDVGLRIDPDQPDSLVEGLRRILTDAALRQTSIQTGLARAATFTWQRAAEIALSVYRHMLDC